MKKFYLFLLSVSMSISTIVAQSLAFDSERANAPQATYTYHFSFDEDGTLETYYFFKGSRTGITAISLVDIIWLPLPNNTNGEQMQYSMSYKSSVGQTHYGQISCPPPGTYTIVTSSSNMDANSKMWAGGDLSYGTVTSSNSATYGYYYNVVADDIYQGTNCDIETTGYADSWISYDGSSATNFKSGSFIVEYGRHGYPYMYSSSLKDTKNNSLNITINESRNLTEVYTSAETVFNAEDMTVTLSGYNGSDNRMSFKFNVSSYDAATGLPAGTYTVGSNVSGIVYDLDGFTSWVLSRGTVAISYDSEGRMSMTVSSLYGLSDDTEYTLNLSMNNVEIENKVCQDVIPFTFNDFYSSTLLSEGDNTIAYHMGWFRNGDNTQRPGLQLSFCFSKSGLRYVNGKALPPDGTYHFYPGMHTMTPNLEGTVVEVSVLKNNIVAAYRWLLWDSNEIDRVQAYSSYIDESNTRYYLNSGYVTISTRSDGVHIEVEANGGTETDGADIPFKFVVQTNPLGYKLDVSEVVGQGSVTKTPDECFYQEGAQVILTPAAEDGWVFDSWTGDCANLITDNHDGTYTYTVPANDCAVIANFIEGIAEYDVVFKNFDEEVLQSGKVLKGEVPVYEGEEPQRPQDEEYTYMFSGWKDTDNNEYPVGTALPAVTGRVTYYAVYDRTAVQYVLTWDVNGGDALTGDYTNGEVEWGTPIITPDNPTRAGYQFEGWLSSITNEIEIPNVMPVSDLTYTAQWTANTYRVHFVSNNGEAADDTSDQYFTYDEEQPLNANVFAWEGHTFLGWAAEENGGVVYTDQQIVSNLTDEPDGTVNLYAVWELTTYTVRFEDYDGSELQTYQLEPNAVPSYEGTPVRENEGDEYNWYEFTFTGWIDGDNNTYTAGSELPAVTGDVTYTAQYSKKLYIILQENMDADYYTNFHNKYNGERATTATLNRQFGQGKWSTLCLPFDVAAGQLTSLGLMNRVYEFKYTKGDEQEGITLYFSQAKKLEAGKGYIVNANATLAKKESFVFSNVLINTNMDEQSGFDISNLTGYNSQGNIYLVGTLRTGKVFGSATGIRYMGLKNNTIRYPNPTQGTTVRAYRGIFLDTGEESLPARVRIVAESEEGEIVSELEVVNGNLEETSETKKFIRDGILYIERNGELFDAQGKRLE